MHEDCQGIIVESTHSKKSNDGNITLFYDIEGNIYEGELINNKKQGYGK